MLLKKCLECKGVPFRESGLFGCVDLGDKPAKRFHFSPCEKTKKAKIAHTSPTGHLLGVAAPIPQQLPQILDRGNQQILNLHFQQPPPAGPLKAVIVRRVGERPFRPDTPTGQQVPPPRRGADRIGPFDVRGVDVAEDLSAPGLGFDAVAKIGTPFTNGPVRAVADRAVGANVMVVAFERLTVGTQVAITLGVVMKFIVRDGIVGPHAVTLMRNTARLALIAELTVVVHRAVDGIGHDGLGQNQTPPRF